MHFDASGIIHAWDEYPIANFPKFWNWIAEQIATNECAISEVAFDEVKKRYTECYDWLRDKRIRRIRLIEEILLTAKKIKALLQIEEEDYSSKGVDENDLIIIATAKIEDAILITQEARQPITPSLKKKNYKIPAVCDLPEVAVSYQSVREWILASGKQFG